MKVMQYIQVIGVTTLVLKCSLCLLCYQSLLTSLVLTHLYTYPGWMHAFRQEDPIKKNKTTIVYFLAG